MREARLIEAPTELEAALFRLRGAERLAIDTEFMRERTYHPQLCLVQVATEADCLLIDPLANLDLAPLYELLQERRRLKILHAARQDLEVLLLAGGAVPGSLFDTQIAAALLGLPAQVGYAELVARQLGHSIDKGQTRTDWSRRPLTPAQLAYAADDVHHLLTLHTELRTALIANGRDAWLAEECAALEDPALYRTDPVTAWRRLKGLNRLKPAEQAVARALAEWRERRAVESNRPRGWILADEALYAIATRAPQSVAALEEIPSLPPGLVKRRGEELLALVLEARACGTTVEAPPPRKPTPEETARANRLMQAVREVAASLGVGPEVLATRRDVEALAYGNVAMDDSPLMRGWRRDVLGEKLWAASGEQ
jgi:ribonuclease D